MNYLVASRRVLGALLIGLGLLPSRYLSPRHRSQQQKPNILFILADNIGYGDIGVYGGGELRGAPTPRIDRLAAEGLRLTQFLVEPACTPSRAALMTGRYSIRSGLSLVAVEGTAISLPAKEITMAEMLRDAGYATAIFGKWHLGAQPYSQPQNKGFDEFYGIPPAVTWDAFLMIPQGQQTKTLDIPLDKGPQIVEAKRGEPLRAVKPYTAEVRREIDWELVDRGIDFMRRQRAAGKPFFLYLPISRTHFPNLPSKRFEGQSRIGQFGNSLMEGDAIVGCSSARRAGPRAQHHRRLRLRQWPHGPKRAHSAATCRTSLVRTLRGALGDVSEGSIRTAAIIRWPNRISSDRPTPCSRSWISSRPSRGLPAARSPTTGQSTALIRATCCSAATTAGGVITS